MQFREISNDDSQTTWVSPEVNYGDFPLRFHIVLEYTESWGRGPDRPSFNYHVSIRVTSLEAAKDAIPRMLQDVMSQDDFDEMLPEHQHEMLRNEGISATLFQEAGNNKRSLVAAARAEMKPIDMLFGFYMDKPQNAIGSTGWDFIKGDYFAASFRARAERA